LGGVRGRHRDHRDALHLPIVLHPGAKAHPEDIRDGFGEPTVLDQDADLQVLQGNQVVRRDERACRFMGTVLALPPERQSSCGPLRGGRLPRLAEPSISRLQPGRVSILLHGCVLHEMSPTSKGEDRWLKRRKPA
jgi:hypothetical protein